MESVGVEPIIHIPERDEGYGPSIMAFDKFAAQGVDFVITVDCGTTAFSVFDYAREKGFEIIVLDHHEAEAKLPDVYAVVNPKRLDENNDYPYLKYMAAVGVVLSPWLLSIANCGSEASTNPVLSQTYWNGWIWWR